MPDLLRQLAEFVVPGSHSPHNYQQTYSKANKTFNFCPSFHGAVCPLWLWRRDIICWMAVDQGQNKGKKSVCLVQARNPWALWRREREVLSAF
jgi:hypothetical protein